MDNIVEKNCQCNDGCCSPAQTDKRLQIDFLYLDLTVCERCQGAENNLDQGVAEVAAVLKSAGYEVTVNKVKIQTRQMAVEYEFISSPTIRVNGEDIAMELRESLCQECGDICGDSVECRVWVYEGSEYMEPPKAMIINAILKAVFGHKPKIHKLKAPYTLPENLKVFFDGC